MHSALERERKQNAFVHMPVLSLVTPIFTSAAAGPNSLRCAMGILHQLLFKTAQVTFHFAVDDH